MRRRVVKKESELNTAGSVLARLKNKILLELGIDYARLLTLVDNYVIQQNGGVESTKSHQHRSNTINEFNRAEMTIKVFVNKFLAVLRANDIKISVTLKMRDGSEVVVHESIVLRDEEGFSLEQLQLYDDEESDEEPTEKKAVKLTRKTKVSKPKERNEKEEDSGKEEKEGDSK